MTIVGWPGLWGTSGGNPLWQLYYTMQECNVAQCRLPHETHNQPKYEFETPTLPQLSVSSMIRRRAIPHN